MNMTRETRQLSYKTNCGPPLIAEQFSQSKSLMSVSLWIVMMTLRLSPAHMNTQRDISPYGHNLVINKLLLYQ